MNNVTREIIAEFEINVKAKIEHTKDSDDTSIIINFAGTTSQDGLRKLVLEIIEKLVTEYRRNRKDVYVTGEKREVKL